MIVDSRSLLAVSCTSPDFCLAVDGSDEIAYDGSAWSAPVATGIGYPCSGSTARARTAATVMALRYDGTASGRLSNHRKAAKGSSRSRAPARSCA